MDFSINIFEELLKGLLYHGYSFYKIKDYQNINSLKSVLLRHDVDKLPNNALNLAQIENSLNIKGTYYFRMTSESYDIELMRKIEDLGHEIGYHYENINFVLDKLSNVKKSKQIDKEKLVDLAYYNFHLNLEKFKKNFKIETISMHGSPRSNYDNKLIWDKYNYYDLGIICEPYLDIDYHNIAYFTDTGRCWNGKNVNVRDKVKSSFSFNFKSTHRFISQIPELPNNLAITFHPQRWNNNLIMWYREMFFQSIKNIIKKNYYVTD